MRIWVLEVEQTLWIRYELHSHDRELVGGGESIEHLSNVVVADKRRLLFVGVVTSAHGIVVARRPHTLVDHPAVDDLRWTSG